MKSRTVGSVLLMVATAAALGGDAPPAEYQERCARMAGELAAAHYALGAWCVKQKLSGEARRHFREVLELQSDHVEAKKALTELDRQLVTGAGTKCELRLRTGERLLARLEMETLCVDTDSGVLFVPVAEVDLIRLGATGGADRVVADGFFGTAHVVDDEFALRGKIGSVKGTRATLEGIRIFHPCPVCQGRGEWKCPHCKGTGRIVEKKVCPRCKGKGKVKCATCHGRGYLPCPHCGGKGFNWGIYEGRRARYHCSYCNHTGKLPCPDCQGGAVECPDCHGVPPEAVESVCPECKGKKILRCTACGGTGIKPLPPNAEKKGKQPAKTL